MTGTLNYKRSTSKRRKKKFCKYICPTIFEFGTETKLRELQFAFEVIVISRQTVKKNNASKVSDSDVKIVQIKVRIVGYTVNQAET